MLSDQEMQSLRNLGNEAEKAVDEIYALRTELSLARAANLAVVRRQQSEIDALKTEVQQWRDKANSAQITIDEAHDKEQSHRADLAASCGCDDGYGQFGYAG